MVDILNGSAFRVALYFVAACCCVVAAGRNSAPGTPRPPAVYAWWTFAAGLVLLGLLRELDGGAWITDRLREAARTEGWYRERRPVQRDLILELTVAAAFGLISLVAFSRGWLRSVMPAFVVFSGLYWFAAVRLVSLHSVDALLYNRTFEGLRLVTVVELAGTLTLSLLALRVTPRRPLASQAAPGTPQP
ncbi:MAG: hypothetical protein ACKVT1_00445 [Dehalococcoidia bacterium]